MKLDKPANLNYAATVIKVGTIVDLPGLDNLVGIPVLGHVALTTRGKQIGDLALAFTAETQLSDSYARENDLFRDETLNKHGDKGYLEKTARIRALKLRGHVSNALLMPLDSVSWTGIDPYQLEEGDTFDVLNGHPICKKYEIPVKAGSRPATKLAKAFKRVTDKVFPMHLDTDNYFRSKHLVKNSSEAIITQKLHGTSWRGGRVPVLREKGRWERFVNRFLGVSTPDHEYDVIFGSRKVIKDPKSTTQNHYYKQDLWTDFGQGMAELIPEGYLVYGELIGWTPGGAALQKNYTYHLPKGEMELYVYRVATINRFGDMADLSWDGVKEFCTARGWKWVPELIRYSHDDLTDTIDDTWDRIADSRLAEHRKDSLWDEWDGWNETPLPLSGPKTVDEGVCVRQDGLHPLILKLKSPVFLEHETKMLDAEVPDLESVG